MAHCGYEPTAADIAFGKPWKMAEVAMRGIRTEGPMAPEIDFSNQRPAIDVHEKIVKSALTGIEAEAKDGRRRTALVERV
jgi:hypothetical protein